MGHLLRHVRWATWWDMWWHVASLIPFEGTSTDAFTDAGHEGNWIGPPHFLWSPKWKIKWDVSSTRTQSMKKLLTIFAFSSWLTAQCAKTLMGTSSTVFYCTATIGIYSHEERSGSEPYVSQFSGCKTSSSIGFPAAHLFSICNIPIWPTIKL